MLPRDREFVRIIGPALEPVMHFFYREATSCAEKKADKGKPMNSFKRACESLVIAAETSESREPAEASFDDPSARKKDKAFSGFLEFDHFKHDAVLLCVPGELFSGIALINPGELNQTNQIQIPKPSA